MTDPESPWMMSPHPIAAAAVLGLVCWTRDAPLWASFALGFSIGLVGAWLFDAKERQ